MFPRRVALAFCINSAVDTTLGTDGMSTFDLNHRKEIDRVSAFGDLHCGSKSGTTATNNRDLHTVARHSQMMPPNSPPGQINATTALMPTSSSTIPKPMHA